MCVMYVCRRMNKESDRWLSVWRSVFLNKINNDAEQILLSVPQHPLSPGSSNSSLIMGAQSWVFPDLLLKYYAGTETRYTTTSCLSHQLSSSSSEDAIR